MEINYSKITRWEILERLHSNSFEMVVVIDRMGFLKFTGNSTKNLLGYVQEDMIGRFYYDLIDHQEWHIAKMIASASIKKNNKESVTTELKLITADGQSIPCELRIENALNDQEVAGMIVYIRPTARKKESVWNPEQSERNSIISMDLPMAIEREELRLHYQPKVNLKTGKVIGVEALVRWEHPELGLIFPNELIPIAEDSGKITSIGNWVIWKACLQNKAWQEQGYPPIIMSVNLSPKQFTDDNLVSLIAQILQVTRLRPQYLELEITESMTADIPHTIRVLHRIKSLGIKISIDDFGTGYSNLNHLKSFPIDILKIDKSFIAEMIHNPINQAIVKTIINLAHDLNLEVVAEGIESMEHLEFLKEHSCTIGQGYLFSKPLQAKELILKIDCIESELQNYM